VRFLLDYRQGIDEWVESAVQAERSYQLDQYKYISEQLGITASEISTIGEKRQDVITALRQALNTAVDAGVLAGLNRATLDEKLTEFEGVQIQAWAESISRILDEENSARLITELSVIPINASRVAKDTFELAEKFLMRTESVILREEPGGHGDRERELNEVQESITKDLGSLIDNLAAFRVELEP